jgi:ADP-ribosylglycohydrolase
VLTALQNSFFRLPRGDLEEGIVQTAPCGGDTDTNGCIAGAPATAWGGPGTLAREGPGLSARSGAPRGHPRPSPSLVADPCD